MSLIKKSEIRIDCEENDGILECKLEKEVAGEYQITAEIVARQIDEQKFKFERARGTPEDIKLLKKHIVENLIKK